MTTKEGGQQEQPTTKFSSPQDEIVYWKLKLEETQTEFQEFQESSRELEAEYETQIVQLEKKNNESLSQISRLEDEIEQLRTRYNAYTNDAQHKLNEYQQQHGELTSSNDRLNSYIRELEQANDDLERAQRTLAASLEDAEAKLNQQIERNVFLENEVSEKEELECALQRLREEVRDLRHPATISKAQQTSQPASPTLPSIVMAPSTRVSAIKIVSNLLRKVGALESSLESAKKVSV